MCLCVCVYFIYQVEEWREVHADGDHAASETELAEQSLSVGEKIIEV